MTIVCVKGLGQLQPLAGYWFYVFFLLLTSFVILFFLFFNFPAWLCSVLSFSYLSCFYSLYFSCIRIIYLYCELSHLSGVGWSWMNKWMNESMDIGLILLFSKASLQRWLFFSFGKHHYIHLLFYGREEKLHSLIAARHLVATYFNIYSELCKQAFHSLEKCFKIM